MCVCVFCFCFLNNFTPTPLFLQANDAIKNTPTAKQPVYYEISTNFLMPFDYYLLLNIFLNMYIEYSFGLMIEVCCLALNHIYISFSVIGFSSRCYLETITVKRNPITK